MKKNKIKQIYDFYKNLDDIKIIYSKIVDSGKEDKRKYGSVNWRDIPPSPMLLLSVSKSSWMEFETLICKLLEEGNPIKNNLFARYFKIS